MSRSQLFAFALLIVAIGMWGGVWFLVSTLSHERLAYADTLSLSQQEDTRGETAARVHASAEATEIERAALQNLVSVSIVQAVDTMEKAGRDAEAHDVAVSDATLLAVAGGLSQYSIAINASGSFAAIMRTVSLFETLPFPASLEQFDISKNDKEWRITAHVRVVLAATK